MTELRDVLATFREELKQSPGISERRNAVRTFHDLLKLALNPPLVRPAHETFLRQLDITKRLKFLSIVEFPELKHFEDLIGDCWTWRCKVEHSDREAPPESVLLAWNSRADEFLAAVERCLHRRSEDEARLKRTILDPRLLLCALLEDAWRLAEMVGTELSKLGLSEEKVDTARKQFWSFYKPHSEWNDAQLRAASNDEVVFGIADIAHKNGFSQTQIRTIAEVLASFFEPPSHLAN